MVAISVKLFAFEGTTLAIQGLRQGSTIAQIWESLRARTTSKPFGFSTVIGESMEIMFPFNGLKTTP